MSNLLNVVDIELVFLSITCILATEKNFLVVLKN